MVESIEQQVSGLTIKTNFRYNENGNNTEQITYNVYATSGSSTETDHLHKRITFLYDKMNILIERVEFDSLENLTEKDNFKYDSRGNLIEWKTFIGRKNISYTSIFAYSEYDHLGNWQEKVSTIESKKKITTRSISYFD